MPKKRFSKHAYQPDILRLDPDSFQQIYNDSYLVVFRFIYGLTGGPIEDVEDLTTSTFLQAWKARNRFRGNQGAALGWLLKIARNLVIDRYRRDVRQGFNLDLEGQILPDPGLTPEEQVSQNEQIQILWILIQNLPAQQKEMIVLRYLLGWRINRLLSF